MEGLAAVVSVDVGQQQKTSPIWVRGQKKAGGPCIRALLGKHRTAREGQDEETASFCRVLATAGDRDLKSPDEHLNKSGMLPARHVDPSDGF